VSNHQPENDASREAYGESTIRAGENQGPVDALGFPTAPRSADRPAQQPAYGEQNPAGDGYDTQIGAFQAQTQLHPMPGQAGYDGRPGEGGYRDPGTSYNPSYQPPEGTTHRPDPLTAPAPADRYSTPDPSRPDPSRPDPSRPATERPALERPALDRPAADRYGSPDGPQPSSGDRYAADGTQQAQPHSGDRYPADSARQRPSAFDPAQPPPGGYDAPAYPGAEQRPSPTGSYGQQPAGQYGDAQHYQGKPQGQQPQGPESYRAKSDPGYGADPAGRGSPGYGTEAANPGSPGYGGELGSSGYGVESPTQSQPAYGAEPGNPGNAPSYGVGGEPGSTPSYGVGGEPGGSTSYGVGAEPGSTPSYGVGAEPGGTPSYGVGGEPGGQGNATSYGVGQEPGGQGNGASYGGTAEPAYGSTGTSYAAPGAVSYGVSYGGQSNSYGGNTDTQQYRQEPANQLASQPANQPAAIEAPPAQGEVAALASQFAQRFNLLAENIERIIKGKRDAVELALVCLFSEGHLLVEDVPGTGKTTLARSIAASVDAQWRRIQFTPDLLPSDITGVSIFNQSTREFEFHQGPVFANIVLGDEINRASPKTQSALLEVMEERRVTVDSEPHAVPRPFLVLATQNPVDMDGTYPLPEAQLDRFLMRISVGYPDHAAEVEVLKGMPTGPQVERLPVVARASDVAGMIDFATRIHVADPIYDYVVGLVAQTRSSPDIRLGASPRASLALVRAARVRAAAAGRHYVVPEDIKALAVPVIAHRLMLTPEAELRERTAQDLVTEILAGMPVPQALAGV
jgi:MoxR-like ATPase